MMNTQSGISIKKRFIRNILLIDIGIFCISGFVSLALQLKLGIVLLILGIVVGGVGAVLGAPNPTDPNNPRNQDFKYFNKPLKQAEDQAVYNVKHAVPSYAFENLLVFAGLLACAVGLILWLLF